MSFDLPSLPEGWCYSSLGQLAQDKSITYGVVQPGSIVEDGVPIVRVNNIRDGRIELADVMKIAPEIESKYLRTRLNGGEVLITIVGSVGQVAIVPESLKGFNIARAVAVIHPREDVSPQWLAICLRSPLSQHLLGSRANTTVQTTINLKDLRELPVPMPPIAERQKIEELIYFLDDRIALLRETNATLEAIAQALFKSWFVDFEPVHAKARGEQPQGMDDATAALFPASFEESGLGMIPKGWKMKTMDDISIVGIGKTPPRKEPQWFSECSMDIPWVSIKDMGNAGAFINQTSEFLTREAVDKFNVRYVPDNTVILSFKLTVGRLSITDGVVTTNEAIAHFRTNENSPLTSEYIYFSLKSFNFDTLSSTSSIANAVNSKTVKSLPVLVPTAKVVSAFQFQVGTIMQRIKKNENQAQTLAQVRDTLLPKLISGQLRQPEAEALLAEELP